ncbi:hypothetical protein JDV02_004328 [Purpureocillium takamizusanense]|uniref:NACHT domain-containing protein n=1 Tax=Purpureocillium takamizusanense TaxID=2060973 RepID=A0A9Q8QFP7_9HYPO|nr:uncharacterized protein JDV02_004328 [Purpureocillium takamizusanense]UNI18031.1 hypothetical protein JDV02_004328 [Purpureocillium takamizusanense]
MAAGSNSSSAAAAAAATCTTWLTAATELYRLLASAHYDEPHAVLRDAPPRAPSPVAADIDVLALHQQMLGATARLPQAVPSEPDDSLLRACRKVGAELCLKLERLKASSCVVEGRVRGAQLRDAWCVEDVDALGGRLEQLVGQCPDDVPFKITIRDRNDAKTTEKSLSRDLPPVLHKDANAGDTLPKAAMENPKESSIDTGNLSRVPAAAIAATQKPRSVPAGLLYEFILDGLAYKSMHDREEEVVQAHQKTFEWVFTNGANDSNGLDSGLSTWFAQDILGPIYWITGKPGSGKSTFMRFLFHHERTAKSLQHWAAGSDVQTAGFFFWTSGSREQRSQTGLLRSLLHQLLSDNVHLIPSTFPVLWDPLRSMSTKERILLTLDWSVKELMEAFHLLLDAALPTKKICLFIDGLDEFDGDHQTIINFFRDLGRDKHAGSIKMCLSSRPWSVFETAFGHSVPHLRLQDLTYDDMHRYTRDRLRESVAIQTIFGSDGNCEQIFVKEAVDRADGVFLWVRLAANEMVRRFTSAHSSSDLYDMLRQLPSELDDLFAKFLFEDQSVAELSQTAVIFDLMCARELVADFVRNDSANSLTVWELAFALEEEDDELVVTLPIEEASDRVVRDRCSSTVRAITRRFANLLDLHSPGRQGNPRVSRAQGPEQQLMRDMRGFPWRRVTYIHRTVRDWLIDGDGVSTRLASYLPPGFDAHLRHLRSYVLRLKHPLEEIEIHRRLDDWWPDIALAMTHARYITEDPRRLQRVFVNQLNATQSELWLRKPQDPYDHWARNAFGSYEVRMKAPPIWQPFLCLATKFGLTEYIAQELEARREVVAYQGPQESDSGHTDLDLECADATPIFSHATEFLCSRNKTIFPLSDPALVRVLLRNETGSDSVMNPGVNHPYTDFMTRAPTTPWLALLRHLRDARRRGWIERYDTDTSGVERWADIVRLFIEVGGADPTAVVVKDSWDPEISALGVLELLDETYGAVEIRDLRQLLAGKLDVLQAKSQKYVLRPRKE